MMEAWPALVFGAPIAIFGLAVCVIGLCLKRPWLVAVGGLAFLPSSLYLAGHPGMGILLFLPLLPLLAAVTLHRGHNVVASVFLLPNAAAVFWLSAVAVLNLVAR